MKKRTFGDGGEVPPGGRFDSDTYARARKWMEAGSPEDKKDDPAKASKPAAKASTAASYSNEGKSSKPTASSEPVSKKDDTPAGEIPKDKDVKAPASKGEDTSGPSNVGRLIAGLGAGAGVAGIASGISKAYKAKKALGAADKAASGSRTLVKSETPVTFLGASGRKNVTPKESVGYADKLRLKGPTSGDRVSQSPSPKSLPPVKAAADTPKLPAPKDTPSAPTPSKPAVKEKVARGPARMMPKKTTKPENPKKPSVKMEDKKPSNPRSRTKYDDTPGVEYKKGGMVRGTGCATKGKKFSGAY